MKRVLLDENLDRRLKNYFSAELEITSVPDLGWQSKKNGELLAAMHEAGIDIPLLPIAVFDFNRILLIPAYRLLQLLLLIIVSIH